MAVASNDRFCSLDMLAEVASATLYSDPSLISISPSEQFRNNIKAVSPKKSVNSFEKLTLEQIKGLSEKNLIEMFSEPMCDEMKRNYSFQCFLIPEKCSQTYKSFGNETRARNKMKMHLLSHIRDLIDNDDHEMFMAEPLHARKKRLKEINRKSIRKKKKSKHLCNKIKKDGCEYLPSDFEDVKFLKGDQKNCGKMKSANFNSVCETDYEFLNVDLTKCESENTDSNYDNVSNDFHFLSSVPLYGPEESSAKQTIFEGYTNTGNFDASFSKNPMKRKQKIGIQVKSKKKTSSYSHSGSFQESDSYHTESNFHFNYYDHPESYLPLHHDHTYTSVNGKTFSCDSSSVGESSKSTNKMYRDPLHPKKITHKCLKSESPLIIPTPPFPYVYIPLLPHIAQIQEVGVNFKTAICKCRNNDIMEGLRDCNMDPETVPPTSLQINELSSDSLCQITSQDSILHHVEVENNPSESYVTDVFTEDRRNGESNDIKLPDASFCIGDLLTPECPETFQAVEKV